MSWNVVLSYNYLPSPAPRSVSLGLRGGVEGKIVSCVRSVSGDSPPEESKVRIRQEGRVSSPKALDNYTQEQKRSSQVYRNWQSGFRVEVVREGVRI